MKNENYTEEIKNRIWDLGEGAVFTASDFSDVASTNVINTTFSRLLEKGMIRRIFHGVYEYPKYSPFLKEYLSASPNDVAETIARKNGWTIVPYGDTALNMLGLSTQVPAVWIYVCDGAYKTYEYGKIKLQFKKTTNKEISNLSYRTALVIQALKALGKDHVKPKHIKSIAYKLTVEDKEKMLSEARYATKWVYETIEKIAKESDYA